jgi:hypothetical protein
MQPQINADLRKFKHLKITAPSSEDLSANIRVHPRLPLSSRSFVSIRGSNSLNSCDSLNSLTPLITVLEFACLRKSVLARIRFARSRSPSSSMVSAAGSSLGRLCRQLAVFLSRSAEPSSRSSKSGGGFRRAIHPKGAGTDRPEVDAIARAKLLGTILVA